MAVIRIHPEAQAEYQAALAWYHARSHQAADRSEAALEHALGLIEATPGLFHSCGSDHRFAMLGKFSYSVIYRVQTDEILVVALAHSRRSMGYWRGRE